MTNDSNVNIIDLVLIIIKRVIMDKFRYVNDLELFELLQCVKAVCVCISAAIFIFSGRPTVCVVI